MSHEDFEWLPFFVIESLDFEWLLFFVIESLGCSQCSLHEHWFSWWQPDAGPTYAGSPPSLTKQEELSASRRKQGLKHKLKDVDNKFFGFGMENKVEQIREIVGGSNKVSAAMSKTSPRDWLDPTAMSHSLRGLLTRERESWLLLSFFCLWILISGFRSI
ncbi:hypothetical protein AMTRI_Chr01g109930 [Amborella trichopoda]